MENLYQTETSIHQSDNPIVRISNVSKSFPGVLAVSSVSLDIFPGEVMALLGQNGAGKSTLVQILAGVHSYGTYTGEVYISEKVLSARTVSEAEDAGIVMIPQHVNVVGDMTVAENIFLNREPTSFGFIDREFMYSESIRVLNNFNVDVDPATRMSKLDISHQQLVTIARALNQNPRVLILDEPTSSLTEVEAQRLFFKLRTLKDRGVACVFVSHRLAEVFEISDRIVVMRDGKVYGDHKTKSISPQKVISEIMGGKSVVAGPTLKDAVAKEEVALQVANLCAFENRHSESPRLKNISFELHRGEILGLFGLVGSGCTAALKTIFGAWPGPFSGEIWIYGKKYTIKNPGEAIGLGLGLVTEDRGEVLGLDQSVYSNIMFASLPLFSNKIGWLGLEKMRLEASQQTKLLNIKARSLDAFVKTLSGGNQQKVIVARWLCAKSNILLLDDPTKGVDVGARAEIHNIMRNLVREDCSILIVVSDAEEAVAVCDRVLTMRNGHIVGEFTRPNLDEGELIQSASGT